MYSIPTMLCCCSYTRKTVKQTSGGHNKCVTLHYNLCPKYFVIPVITVLIALKVPADIHVVLRHVKGPLF